MSFKNAENDHEPIFGWPKISNHIERSPIKKHEKI